MPDQFMDLNAPSLQGKMPKLPADLPHGLIAPPERVRELLEKERTKHPPEVFARHEERLMNEWTLQYYFDYLGHEVLYRITPQGPEVLAVGFDEMLAFTKDMALDERLKLKTWTC